MNEALRTAPEKIRDKRHLQRRRARDPMCSQTSMAREEILRRSSTTSSEKYNASVGTITDEDLEVARKALRDEIRARGVGALHP